MRAPPWRASPRRTCCCSCADRSRSRAWCDEYRSHPKHLGHPLEPPLSAGVVVVAEPVQLQAVLIEPDVLAVREAVDAAHVADRHEAELRVLRGTLDPDI